MLVRLHGTRPTNTYEVQATAGKARQELQTRTVDICCTSQSARWLDMAHALICAGCIGQYTEVGLYRSVHIPAW